MSLPFVELILQRSTADCGITALAMLLGRPYEDVFVAAITKKYRQPHKAGMYARQIQELSRRLGTKLVLKRTWDLENSCGLLTVEKIDKTEQDFAQHLVLLKFGLIFDTDATCWEPDFYFEKQGFKPVSILVEMGEEG